MLIHKNQDELTCLHEEENGVDFDPMKRKETLELVSAYYKINNRKLAQKLFDLIVALSKSNIHLPDDKSDI